jgi:hypothetical protein
MVRLCTILVFWEKYVIVQMCGELNILLHLYLIAKMVNFHEPGRLFTY